ncbi:alpha/beta hydrolase [Bisgaard Taxon 10/6]|uniref:alpha/beta hydrolase n=1 Tax=Exercitatus varius TaxID=67857 RepID=UPI00294B885F|nr:alpha/beta hydrolase [Exercitatus varius]MDG2961153.1 alpha/beta hydrolase [Exercitatus varius]
MTWSGSVSPSLVFFRAEMYANEAGRELAKVLIQLIKAEIRINIITHSLGARVALSALNILGDFDGTYNEKIDNLIMWEAAVADNAITDTYTRAKNPVAMELFPFAHKAVKRMRILYSQEDGVLGEDNSLLDFDDGISDISRGAYPKKYTSVANTTGALKDYYHKQNKIGEYYTDFENLRRDYLLHRGSLNQDDIAQYENMANTAKGREIKRSIEKLLLEEAEMVSSDLNKLLNYLKPWSHFRRFRPDDEYFKHIVEVVTSQVFNNWTIYTKDMAVRSALGHQGERLTIRGLWFNNKELSELRKKEWADPFIENLENKKFFFFDQSVTDKNGHKRYYFISHSAMREYEWAALDTFKPKIFPDVYEYSYRREIINRIKENSHFGRYEK